MSNYQPTPHTTATQPPTIVPFPSLVLADAGTHPFPRFSRADPPTVKTWVGIHPRTPTSMSFRAQRSGAGESCCRINPSPIGATLMIARPNGFTQPFPPLHTSFPHPPVIPAPPSVVPAKAGTHPSFNPPVPVGAVREPPVPFPSLVLADAGTPPSLRFPREAPALVKTGPESIPSPEGATLVVALIRLIPPSPVGAGFRARFRSSNQGIELVRSQRHKAETAYLLVVYRSICGYGYACRHTLLPRTGARGLLKQALQTCPRRITAP